MTALSNTVYDYTKPTTFSAIFRQICPPTIVDKCLYCNVIHPKFKNLVLSRGTYIDLYSVKYNEFGEVYFNWLSTAPVYQEIADIVAVTFSGDALDSLIISFPEAKILSLQSGRTHFTKLPILRIDYHQRCAVMLVYDQNLAVLPFRRTEVFSSENKSNEINATSKYSLSWQQRATAPLLATFTTSLSTSTGEKINNIIDMQFLHGFYEPTLLVLYEPIGTWAGRVSARRDTCCIVALSFNLQKRTNPVIWFQELLPFDCHSILPIPEPIGGVVILATNSIIYLKQTLPSCGLPLNCYGQISTNFPMRHDIPLCGPLSLDCCRAVNVDDSQFLIGSRSGQIYLLSLWLEQATQTVTSLLLHEIGLGVPPHCMTLLDQNCLFIGSKLCDSLLLQFTCESICVDAAGKPVTIGDELQVENGNEPDSSEDIPSKKSCLDIENTTNSIEAKDKLLYNFDEVDVELYGESILNPPCIYRQITSYQLKIVDRLFNFGPIGQLTSGEVQCLAPGNTDPTDEALTQAQSEMHHIEMVATVPRLFNLSTSDNSTKHLNAGLLLLHTSVRPRGLTAFELPEYVSLWSLYGPPIVPVNKCENVSDTSIGQSAPSDVVDELQTNSAVSLEMDDGNKLDNVKEEVNDEKVKLIDQNEENEMKDASAASVEDSRPSLDASEFNEPPTKQVVNQSSGMQHSYLLLTREDSTMILEVSHEIVELEVSGFNTTEMTVGAFNLGLEYIEQSKKSTLTEPLPPVASAQSVTPNTKLTVGVDYPYILQVSPTSLRLLDGPRLIEYVQITLEWRIHLASAADPFVLLCTEDDELFLVQLKHPDQVKLSTAMLDQSKLKVITSSLVSQGRDDDSTAVTGSDESQSLSTPHLEITRPKVGQVSAPLCFTIYHDRSGHLTKWLWTCRNLATDLVPETSVGADQSFSSTHHTWPNPGESVTVNGEDQPGHELSVAEEEDLFLYGETIEMCKTEPKKHILPKFNSKTDVFMRSTSNLSVSKPDDTNCYAREATLGALETKDYENHSNYFAFIVFTNGVLEIYSLPDFTLLYEVRRFSDLPSMLNDHRGVDLETYPLKVDNAGASLTDEETVSPPISEILIYSFGLQKDRPPVMVVRTNQEIVLFEALCPTPFEAYPTVPGMSFYETRLRWRRLPIVCPLLAPKRIRNDPKIADVELILSNRSTMLRSFDNIGAHRGVFVCGCNPLWLFGTKSGQIRVFPHSIDGIMGSFAPLNAQICQFGFVYFTYSNEMRLAILPPGYSYEEHLGTKSIHLECVPNFVQYHVESKTYAVIGVQSRPRKSIFRLNAEGNKVEETLVRPDSCVLPSLDFYSLQMYASDFNSPEHSWDLIPNTTIEFEPWEVVSCLITAQLTSEQTFHGLKDYLALGSNLSYGEEIPVRGRIMIFDLIDVVPEPGQPLTRHKLKLIHDGEQKGPIAALTSCQGHLISAVGQKIYIWSLKNADLVGVAFVDCQIHIHNLLCVKNLVLATDVLKSAQLLRFQSDLRVLSVVSRDYTAREVYTSNFFVDGRRLGFLLSDELGNVIIYSYDPLDPTSRSGRRLVRRADMRLPFRATCSLRVANRLRHALLSVKPSLAQAASGGGVDADLERFRHSVYFGTQSGAIYQIGPIRDKMFSRLRITEKNLIHYLGPTCGMPPKTRLPYDRPQPELTNPCDKVCDGTLVWRYLALTHRQRLEIAKKSGQTLEGIMDDIAELIATTLHY